MSLTFERHGPTRKNFTLVHRVAQFQSLENKHTKMFLGLQKTYTIMLEEKIHAI